MGSGMGGGMGNVGPLMFVRGMAKKKGGRVKDRRIRMSPSHKNPLTASIPNPIPPFAIKDSTFNT